MRQDPEADATARRLEKRGQMRSANALSGFKFPGLIKTESRLQSYAVMMGELDPRVAHIRVEPFSVDLRSGRRSATKADLIALLADGRTDRMIYTPDLEFRLFDGTVTIVECKDTYWIEKDPKRVAQCLEIMPQLGFRFRLYTEQDLTDVLGLNLAAVRPYIRHQVNRLDEIRHCCALPTKISCLEGHHGFDRCDILASIAQGHLAFNLRLSRVSEHTLLQTDPGDRAYLKVLAL